jgi:hypothetical protein
VDALTLLAALPEAAKTEQVGGRKSIGEASALETCVSEAIGRGRRDATVCSGL